MGKSSGKGRSNGSGSGHGSGSGRGSSHGPGGGTNAGVTLNGTSGNDYLNGGNGDDQLYGGAGNDRINGGNGNDFIDGGSGNDRIDGGDGNDVILGGAGNDNIKGGKGNDTITGGAGNDQIDGGSGIDTAVYSGNFRDYKLTLSRDGGHSGPDDDDRSAMTVHEKRPGSPDGVDVLKNVEVLRFADGEYRGGVFYPNTGGNNSPTITVTASAITENSAVAGMVAATYVAADVDGDTLTVGFTAGSNTAGYYALVGGQVVLTAAGAAWVNAGNALPAVSLTVSDGALTATGSATPAVTLVNDAPVVTNTGASGDEDTTLTGVIIAVDEDGATTFALASGGAPANGAVVVDANGSYSYTPAANFHGADSFIVTLTDAQGHTQNETVHLTVNSVNDAPVAEAATAAATEGVAVVTGQVSATDVDSLSLTYSLVGTAPAGLSFNSDGSYSFDPSVDAYDHLAAGATQDVVVQFTASDGSDSSAVQTLTIRVTGTNDAPVAQAQSSAVAATEGDALVAGSVSATDVDNGAVLTYSLTGVAPAGLTFNSDGTYSFDPTVGAYDYLAEGETLVVVAGFKANDGALDSAEQTLTITLTGTNDAPTVAGALVRSVDEDYPLSIDLLQGASDVDGVDLNVTNVVPPAGLVVSGNSLSLDPAAFQSLSAGQSTLLTIEYDIVDDLNAAVHQTLSLTVTGVNDAPHLVADANVVKEDEFVGGVVSATGNVLDNDTDIDAGDTLFVSSAGTFLGTYGTLLLNTDGTYTYTLNNSSTLVQALEEGQEVQEQFASISVSDGEATLTSTLTITVSGTNDAPVLVPGGITAAAFEGDAPFRRNLLAGASDNDAGAVLSVVNVSGLGPGLELVLSPNPLNPLQTDYFLEIDPTDPSFDSLAGGELLVISVNYQVMDQYGSLANSTGLLTLTLTGVNDPPVANTDTLAANEDAPLVLTPTDVATLLVGNDFDAEGDTLTAVSFSNAVNGTISVDALTGNVTFLSAANYSGPASFLYTISDGEGGTATGTVLVDVTAVADAPNLLVTPAAGTSGSSIALVIIAGLTDPSETLSVTISGIPAGASLSVGTDNLDGSWTLSAAQLAGLALQAPAGLVGTLTLGVTATSTEPNGSAASVTGSLLVDVLPQQSGLNALPDAAVIDADASAAPHVATGDVLVNDSSTTPGAVLSVGPLMQTSAYGTLVLAADGTYTYTLNTASAAVIALGEGAPASDVFNVTVFDLFNSASSTLTITILGDNDAPMAISDTVTVGENAAAVLVDVAGNDVDPDVGDALTLVFVGPGPAGSVVGIQGGSVSFAPGTAFDYLAVGESAQAIVSYTVSDGALTSTSTLTVTVNGANDAPEAAPLDDVAFVGETYTGYMPGTDVDVSDFANLAFSVAGAGPDLVNGYDYVLVLAHGTLWFMQDGSFDYEATSVGSDSFTYTVSDDLVSATATVTLDVQSSEPPLFTDGDNVVDFNGVVPSYLPGTQYEAGDGNDTVILPLNAAVATSVGYDLTLEFYAGAGNDTVTGGNEGDTIYLEADDDLVFASGGIDTLNGGSGNDTVSYYQAVGEVTVNLTTSNAFKLNGIDTLNAFENVIGSPYNDIINGDAGDNVIEGGLGADTLSGGDGSDTVSYAHAGGAVQVDLASGTVSSADGADVISGFENIRGSDQSDAVTDEFGDTMLVGDTLIGDALSNVLRGGLGNDYITGGGGADTFAFGAGESGMANNDVIMDFSLAQGDKLDIRDLLVGYSGSNVNDFVQLFDFGGSTLVAVDADGSVGGSQYQQVAFLLGVDVATLADPGAPAADHDLEGAMLPSYNLMNSLLDTTILV